MKRIFFLCAALVFAVNVVAQEAEVVDRRANRVLKAGYRGALDVEVGYLMNSLLFTGATVGVSTTHGYQLSPHVFVGAGVGVHLFDHIFTLDDEGDWDVTDESTRTFFPVFGDLKVSLLKKWVTPQLNLKVGYTFGDYEGAYVNPSAGVRFGFGERFGLRTGLGYVYQDFKNVSSANSVQFFVGIDF